MYPPSVNEARELAEDMVRYISDVDYYGYMDGYGDDDMTEDGLSVQLVDIYTGWILEGDCQALMDDLNDYIAIDVALDNDKRLFREGRDGYTVKPSLHWMVRDEHAEGKDLLRRI